ncbi:MAG TPA: hypothetical protein VMF06_11240 [Candidatus Limnocylindria bacterium]|nr:hypothetical protein [Candidatus Limnocylindria bacterium]
MKKLYFLLLAIIVFMFSGWVQATPHPTDKRVLILSTTISPATTASWEAQTAIGLGFTVNIATPSDWAAIGAGTPPPGFFTFDRYWALILGDPTCVSGTNSLIAADANKAVWSPIVRNGNIIINGEDFSFHAGSQIGARTFMTNAIRFAVDCPTNTGLYASLSCYYSGIGSTLTPVPALSLVSLAGGFSVVGGNDEKAHLTATHPALSGLTDANLSNYSQSSHNLFGVWPSDFTVLAMMLDANPADMVYTAGDGTKGAPYILAKGKGLVSIGSACLSIKQQTVDCLSTNMTYQWQFCVTNTGADPIQYLSLLNVPPGLGVTPDLITLPSILTTGQGTCLSVIVTNTTGAKSACLTIGAHTTNFFKCCSITNCLDFAPCCLAFSDEKLVPVAGTGCYNYTFSVRNVSATPIKYIFLIQDPAGPPTCVTFTPDIVVLPPLLPGVSAVRTVKVCFGAGCPAPHGFLAGAADTNLVNCCSTHHVLPLPSTGTGTSVLSFAAGFDGSLYNVGTDIPIEVDMDPKIVQPRHLTILAGDTAIQDFEFGPTTDPSGATAVWKGVPEGIYTLMAQETDTLGGVWYSEPATIYVVKEQAHSDGSSVPRLSALKCVDHLFTFCLETQSGVVYHIETTGSLSSPAWKEQQTIIGDNSTVTVTNSLPNVESRFYRLRVDQ